MGEVVILAWLLISSIALLVIAFSSGVPVLMVMCVGVVTMTWILIIDSFRGRR